MCCPSAGLLYSDICHLDSLIPKVLPIPDIPLSSPELASLQIYVLHMSSGGWAPCSTVFFHQVSVLGTHLHQRANWCYCERLCSASVNFFLRLNAFAHFVMGDLRMHLLTLC